MSSNANLPPVPCFVWTKFLYDNDNQFEGKTPATLVSVRAQQNQALQFSVLLNNGALFTGLPAHAITFDSNEFMSILSLQEAQMWDCISNHIEVFTMESLRYAHCEVRGLEDRFYTGEYLFTIDFVNDGFSRHPTHWKQLHAVNSEGRLMLYPQYRIQFTDEALLEDRDTLPKYKANTTHWIVGS
jgi:hypothetical protein